MRIEESLFWSILHLTWNCSILKLTFENFSCCDIHENRNFKQSLYHLKLFISHSQILQSWIIFAARICQERHQHVSQQDEKKISILASKSSYVNPRRNPNLTFFPVSLSPPSSPQTTTEIANLPVQPHVGVHELAEARIRQNLRRGNPAGADVQGQVRTADWIAQEWLHQRAGAVRHDEGGPQSGRQRVRHCHAPGITVEVSAYLTYTTTIRTVKKSESRENSIVGAKLLRCTCYCVGGEGGGRCWWRLEENFHHGGKHAEKHHYATDATSFGKWW